MTNLLLTLYKLMLRLYPSRFYQIFGSEMIEVFAEKLHHAAGNRAVLAAFGRELRHWPASCLREHWSAQQAAFNFPTYEKLSWRGTAVAALPYLLIALVYAALTVIPNQNFFNFLLLGTMIIVLAVAWWQRWPAWSASWLGFLAYVLFDILLPQYIWLGQSEWTATERLVRMMFTEMIYFLSLFCVFYWLVGRWPRAGAVGLLLSIGFTWRLHMDFVSQNLTTFIQTFTWVWLAVTAGLLARWVPLRRQSWILGLAALVIGLLAAFGGQFWVDIPRTGSFASMMENLLSEFVPTLLPLMAILLLHVLRRNVMGYGRSVLRHYRFLFWGIVGFILASQVAQGLFLPVDLAMFQARAGIVITAVFLLSLLGIIKGVRGLRHSQPGRLLLMLVVLFPFLYQAEVIGYSLFFSMPFLRLPNEFVWYEIMRLGSQAAGLVWLGLSAWMLGRISPPLPEEPSNDTIPTLAN